MVVECCIRVTGTVINIKYEDDGDAHLLLQPDKGQGHLINKANRIEKGSYLVVEIICAGKITQGIASGACIGYTNNITVPEKGQHISVTGSYVKDKHNGWMEIHPVSKIEVLN